MNDTLYSYVANRDLKTLYKVFDSKKILSDYEKAILSLAYVLQGRIVDYLRLKQELETKSISLEAQTVLAEAELMADVNFQKPRFEIDQKASEILRTNSKAIFAWSIFAQSKFASKNYEEAISTYELIKTEYPQAAWINRQIAHYLILGRQFKLALKYIQGIADPVQRNCYKIAAKYLLPFRPIIYGAIALFMMTVQKDIDFWFMFLVVVLLTPLYIYFVRIKDKFLLGIVGSLIAVTFLFYFVAKYVHL